MLVKIDGDRRAFRFERARQSQGIVAQRIHPRDHQIDGRTGRRFQRRDGIRTAA